MKYMGSKRVMLQNGLGDLIAREARGVTRFVDLFAGSGAVATHVAMQYKMPVAAYDLQLFSTVLTQSIVGREARIDPERLWSHWYGLAQEKQRSLRPPSSTALTSVAIERHRSWCADQEGIMTKAYGGHYFSPLQATWLDALRQTLPEREPWRTTALAAMIRAASHCAAAPGHTAQPFQPTRTAKPFLIESWTKDFVASCHRALGLLAGNHAKVRGTARVADANIAARAVRPGDLVFVDPPYSGVHYSRFYHVLETLARGHCGEVSGTGRYPAPSERPRSKYSLVSESSGALDDLFGSIASRGGTAIVTFPQRECSNGLSGRLVTRLARAHFRDEQHSVVSRLSTLGGNNDHRTARQVARELILVLRPARGIKAGMAKRVI